MNEKLNGTAVNTALTINCYIINRLAENSNICKTITVAIAAAYISLTNNPTEPKFWFVAGIVFILMILDSLYIGLKKNLQSLSQKLIIRVTSENENDDFNPFDKKTFIDEEDLKSNRFNTSKSFRSKIFYKVKTVFKGLISMSIWPFYIIILAGLCYIQFQS